MVKYIELEDGIVEKNWRSAEAYLHRRKTIYKGIKTTEGGPQLVWKEVPQSDGRLGQVPLDPSPSQKLYNHSPDGFQWGYSGSGPAQLALALLLDVTGDGKLSVALHQDFKRNFIATWGESWQMEADQILHWVELRQQ